MKVGYGAIQFVNSAVVLTVDHLRDFWLKKF